MTTYRAFSVASLTAALASATPAHAAQPSQDELWDFDKDEVGKLAAGWRMAETNGTGKTGSWTVVADESAPSKSHVLNFEARADKGTYNLLLADKSSFRDLDLRARVKANGGKIDQGGGLVWRCKDENNYYICRVNPLESNFRVYRVEGGKRTELMSAELETKTGQWYEVRAVMIGDKIECYVDGKKHLAATDATFKQAGMVGLWTKADASSSFDDVAIRAPSPDETPKDGGK